MDGPKARANFSSPKISFYTFPSNFAKFTCLGGCRVWLKSLTDVSLPISTCLTNMMNNLSLESYSVGVFKYYAFDNFSCDIFADVISFTTISGKIRHVALRNSIQPYLMFLVYLLAINGSSVCRSPKKLKNERFTMLRGSAVQKKWKNISQ